MAKQCLCVEIGQVASDLPVPYWNVFLKDRSVVDDENNLDKNILQLIPYISFVRKVKEAEAQPWDMEVLTYVRSKASGENRLHDKLSIGYGGHIDRIPAVNETLLDLVISEAIREVKEELGYDVPYQMVAAAAQMELLVRKQFLYSESVPVDTVHLGIALVIQLDDDVNAPATFVGTDGECIDINWMKIETIDDDTLGRFETWSNMVVSGLRAHVLGIKKHLTNEAVVKDSSSAIDMPSNYKELLEVLAAAGEAAEGQEAAPVP